MSRITYEYFFPFFGPEEVREHSEAGDNEEIDLLDYFNQNHGNKNSVMPDLFNLHYEHIEKEQMEHRIDTLLLEKQDLADQLTTKEQECNYWKLKHSLRASYIAGLEKKIEMLELRNEGDQNLLKELQEKFESLQTLHKDKDAWEAQVGWYIDPMDERERIDELEKALKESQQKIKEVRVSLVNEFSRKQAEFEKVLDSLSDRLKASEARVEELDKIIDNKEKTIRDLIFKLNESNDFRFQQRSYSWEDMEKSMSEVSLLRESLKSALEEIEKNKDEQKEGFLESCIVSLVEENDKLSKALSKEQKFREQVLLLATQEK